CPPQRWNVPRGPTKPWSSRGPGGGTSTGDRGAIDGSSSNFIRGSNFGCGVPLGGGASNALPDREGSFSCAAATESAAATASARKFNRPNTETVIVRHRGC